MAVNFPQGSRGILTSDSVITSSGSLNFGSREYVVCNPSSSDITLTVNDSASSEFVENRLMFIENKSNIYGVRLVSDSNQYIDTVPPQGLKILRSNQANPINSIHFDFLKSIENKTGNMLRNGNFYLWSRGTSMSCGLGVTRLADGWRTFIGSTPPTLTASRNTDVPSNMLMGNSHCQYSLNVQVASTTTANAQCMIGHVVEGYIYRTFFRKPLVVSFWVKSNKVGLYTFHLRNNTYSRSFLKGYTINNADTWEKKIIYVEPNNDNDGYNFETGLGIDVVFNLHPDGTTGVEGWNNGTFRTLSGQVTFCDNTSNYFRIANVCIALGSNVDNFTYFGNSFHSDHLLNFRYFFNKNSFNTNPFLNIINTNTAVGRFRFPCEFRIIPSVDWPDHLTANKYVVSTIGNRTGTGTFVNYPYTSEVHFEAPITPTVPSGAITAEYQGQFSFSAEI